MTTSGAGDEWPGSNGFENFSVELLQPPTEQTRTNFETTVSSLPFQTTDKQALEFSCNPSDTTVSALCNVGRTTDLKGLVTVRATLTLVRDGTECYMLGSDAAGPTLPEDRQGAQSIYDEIVRLVPPHKAELLSEVWSGLSLPDAGLWPLVAEDMLERHADEAYESTHHRAIVQGVTPGEFVSVKWVSGNELYRDRMKLMEENILQVFVRHGGREYQYSQAVTGDEQLLIFKGTSDSVRELAAEMVVPPEAIASRAFLEQVRKRRPEHVLAETKGLYGVSEHKMQQLIVAVRAVAGASHNNA